MKPTVLSAKDLETVSGGEGFPGYPRLMAYGDVAHHIMSNPDMRFTVTPLGTGFSRVARDR